MRLCGPKPSEVINDGVKRPASSLFSQTLMRCTFAAREAQVEWTPGKARLFNAGTTCKGCCGRRSPIGAAKALGKGVLMKGSKGRGRVLRGLVAVALATGLSLGAAAGTATAAAPQCAGAGVPVSKVSIQLWTFAEYIGFGTDAATIARTEEVLRRLSEMGYRNVEPFTLSGLTADQYRALLDKYGLKASARHVDVGRPGSPANLDQILADNRTLGIKFFGSG